jgi:sugar transferase (PEP-CTERM/EpsH1 system associated)
MRVLVLTHRLPYAPNRGDRLRAYHTLRGLVTRADVELVSLVHDVEEGMHIEEVRAFIPKVHAFGVPRLRNYLAAARKIITRTPLTHCLLDSPAMIPTLSEIVTARPPDVVLAYCSGMARFAMAPPLSRVPFVLDFVDVDSRKWLELADNASGPLSWIYRREAVTLGAFEARAARRAAAAIVVNEREAAVAQELAPGANIHVVHNGVELERLRPPEAPSAAPHVVFCGVMNYAPNDQGMQWFVRDIWPLVRAQRADAQLTIVGADPTAALRALCRLDASIAITGRVSDVRPWLWQSAVGIAPLHVARGVQNKALEAIAAGLPIVVTSAVAGGLPPLGEAAAVADDPAAFARHVIDILALLPDARRGRAATADLGRLNWTNTLLPLWRILEHASMKSCAESTLMARTPAISIVDKTVSAEARS